jgi:hypothetical protein
MLARVLTFFTLAPSVAAQGLVSTELAKLTASDAADHERFGFAVALSGDTALAGAWLDEEVGSTGPGAAYVFERDHGGAGAWGEVAKLVAADGAAFDSFGVSVALRGDTAVVGSYRDDNAGGVDAGAAYVFARDQGGANVWGEVVKLVAADAAAGDRFGIAVALSGDTIVVGARRDDNANGENAGAAYVFERDQGGANAWGEVAKLTAGDGAAGDLFGRSAALSGDTAVIGARLDDNEGGQSAGAAYVFERDQGGAGAWGEVAKLTASDGAAGDLFGHSVAVDGDTIVVGSEADDHSGLTNSGSAYVFVRDHGGAGAWGEARKLTAGDAAGFDVFGSAVSVFGETIAVGADQDEHTLGLPGSFSSGEGATYVFERDHGGANAWGEVEKLTSSDPASGDHFGSSVALSGCTAVVGAALDDHAGGTNAGSAYVFSLLSVPGAIYCTAGVSAGGCQATLSAAGIASATAPSGFLLTASNVEGAKDGLFFFGSNGRQASPWGSGTSYQCVVPPVRRAGLLAGRGTNGTCDGTVSQDLNARWCPTCPKPNHNPGAGALVQAQLWYRDPLNTSNRTTSLSDAIELCVQP